jgi:hypothetical protein
MVAKCEHMILSPQQCCTTACMEPRREPRNDFMASILKVDKSAWTSLWVLVLACMMTWVEQWRNDLAIEVDTPCF